MLSPVKIWRRQKEIRTALHQQGEVISWTRIYTPPEGFRDNAPYYVVLVQFKNGEKAFGQLVDCSESNVKIGMKVLSTLRKVRKVENNDVISYGLKFIPLSPNPSVEG